MDVKLILDEPVTKYMSKNMCKVSPGATVTEAAKAMESAGASAALAMAGDTPRGIITERDILYKVVAKGHDPNKVSVQEFMTTPIHTISETSKTGDAIARMSKLGVRRLAVESSGRIIGMVTQRSIVSGTVNQQVLLPELTSPEKLKCPYCDESMSSPEELSRHIDNVHIGLGLLEGDVSKW
jgi:signal-transduction protein with cAMP-binding, CBS, and nucleotidyltransferase domain